MANSIFFLSERSEFVHSMQQHAEPVQTVLHPKRKQEQTAHQRNPFFQSE